MNLNLEKLSWFDRIVRFFIGHRKIYWEQTGKKRKKLTKSELNIDIIIWNVVSDSDPEFMNRGGFGEAKVKYGNILLALGDNYRKITRVETCSDGVSVAISRSTGALIVSKTQGVIKENEKKQTDEKMQSVKNSLYEGYVESKGL